MLRIIQKSHLLIKKLHNISFHFKKNLLHLQNLLFLVINLAAAAVIVVFGSELTTIIYSIVVKKV